MWPYVVGGYLRAITPEVAVYSYPHFADAQRLFGKQRSVLLLDVLDKIYNNNMRQIGIQRLAQNEDALADSGTVHPVGGHGAVCCVE